MNFDASRMLAFDLETTSANPKEARIVTSALVRIDGRDVQEIEHLADPGIEIPRKQPMSMELLRKRPAPRAARTRRC